MQGRHVFFLISVTVLCLAMFTAGVNWKGVITINVVPVANCSWVPPYNITWIAAEGIVSTYGSASAYGWIDLYGVEEEWAEVKCIFTVPPIGPDIIFPSSVNFTLYIAEIYNTSIVKLDYNDCDLYISGFWKVPNTSDSSDPYWKWELGNITLVAGEFTINGNWTHFIMNIEGFESTQGSIINYFAGEIEIRGRYPIGDLNRDGIIDIKDLLRVALAYGQYLGTEGYFLSADVNFDLFIDIKDILEIALTYGVHY